MADEREGRFGAFLGGALLGGALGAVLGLLMAPRTGTETRHQLSEGVADFREKGAKLVEDVRESAGSRFGNVRETLGKKISLISEAIDAGRKAAGDVRTEPHSMSEARPANEETQGG
jgi:gas vesicle protein